MRKKINTKPYLTAQMRKPFTLGLAGSVEILKVKSLKSFTYRTPLSSARATRNATKFSLLAILLAMVGNTCAKY